MGRAMRFPPAHPRGFGTPQACPTMTPMKRIAVLALFTLAATAALAQKPLKGISTFNVVEASIPEIQEALKSGKLTSHELGQQYLLRIATYEHKLHPAATINPNA